MDTLFERLEALSDKLPVDAVTVYAARSSRGRARTYHLSRFCKKFRASYVDRVTFTSHQARALCPVCVAEFPSQPDTSDARRAHVALELMRSACDSLGRAELHYSEKDPSLSDTWAGRVLRSAEVAAGLGVPEVSSLASDAVLAARKLTKPSAVSSAEFAAAELGCAFVHASRQSPASPEQERLLGGEDKVSRFAQAMLRNLAGGLSREAFLDLAVSESWLYFGREPQWIHQLPERPFPSDGDVSVRVWANVCWREARDEAVLELATRWYDQGALALAAAPRKSLIFGRCSPRGDLALVATQMGALRVPDRYIVVFEDVASTTASALRLLAERETLTVLSDRVSAEVLETAVGLYDPRSSGPLKKLAGALNAAKAV